MRWKVLQNKDGLTVNEDHVVAITNGGGIRAAIAKGDVTKKDINTVLPFGNTVAVVYVTGEQLLEALEASTFSTPTAVGGFPQVSGINFTIHTGKAYDKNDATYPESTYYGPKTINRVVINSVNGKEFKANEVYAVVTNNFCAAGGDTYYAFKAASAQFDTGIPLDEAVMEYVTKELKGVIGEQYAAPQGRITYFNPFKDVKTTSWYFNYMIHLYEDGVISGTSATTYTPDAKLSWAAALKLLACQPRRSQGCGRHRRRLEQERHRQGCGAGSCCRRSRRHEGHLPPRVLPGRCQAQQACRVQD